MDSAAQFSPHSNTENGGVYKWVLVGFLFLVAALNYADRSVLSAMYPLLQRELRMTDLGLAGIGTVFLWSYAAASPFAGMLGDRLPRRGIILVCLAGWSLVMAVTSRVSGDTQLLCMRFFLGVTEAFYIPASVALISEYHGLKTRATAMAIHVAGMSVGAIAGGTYGGYIGEHYGWRPAILYLGVTGVVLAAIGNCVIRRKATLGPRVDAPAKPRVGVWHATLTVLRNRLCVLVIFQAMLLSIGTWIFSNWLPLYFTQVFHMTLGGAGFAGTAALNLGSILGILGGGWISDRAARRHPLNRFAVQAGLYCAAVPFLLLFFGSTELNIVAFSIFGFSLCRAMGQASEVPILCERLPNSSRATAMGLFNCMNCLAGGLGILVSVRLKALFGLKVVFVGSSALIVLAGVLLFWGYAVARRRELAVL